MTTSDDGTAVVADCVVSKPDISVVADGTSLGPGIVVPGSNVCCSKGVVSLRDAAVPMDGIAVDSISGATLVSVSALLTAELDVQLLVSVCANA